jgi:hypothetical protein
MEHRRGAGAEIDTGRCLGLLRIWTAMRWNDRLGPRDRAVHGDREQRLVADQHVDVLSVGDRGFGGEAVLRVPGDRRRTALELPLPADFAGVEVDRIQHPAMDRVRERFAHAAGVAGELSFFDQVESRLGWCFVADRRGHEDRVSPDNRRAPAEAGHPGLPHDVLGCAPSLGKRRVVIDDPCVWTPEAGPVLDRRQGGHGEHDRRCRGQQGGAGLGGEPGDVGAHRASCYWSGRRIR